MFGKNKGKSVTGNCISGIDIPENVQVTMTLTDAGISLNVPSLKKDYSIAIEKIQSVNYYNETEIEKYTDSSFGSAVIGAAAFGVIGAVIGSRPKTREKKKVSFFLLVQYDDKMIILESEDGFAVGQIVDYFKKLKPAEKAEHIEL